LSQGNTLLEKNVAAARRMFDELFNQGKLEVIDEISRPDLVNHDPTMEIHGREAMKKFVTTYRTAFPDLHYIIEDVLIEGDTVGLRWTARGTHTGQLYSITPTGKRVTFTGMHMYHLIGGKIREIWGSWDTIGMIQQISTIPTSTLSQRP
jgi:predicted ester cyclase